MACRFTFTSARSRTCSARVCLRLIKRRTSAWRGSHVDAMRVTVTGARSRERSTPPSVT